MQFRISTGMLLALLFGILALAGQLISQQVTSGVLNETVRLREFDKVKTLGNVIGEMIERHANQTKLVARLLAADIDLANALKLDEPRRHERLTEVLHEPFRRSGVKTLDITGADDTIIYRAHDVEKTGGQAKGWGIAETLAGKGMLISTRGKDGISIKAIEPLWTGGEVVGTISAGIELDKDFTNGLSSDVGANLTLLGRTNASLSDRTKWARGIDGNAVTEAFQKKVPIYRIDSESRRTSAYLPIIIVDEAYVILAELDSTAAYLLIDRGIQQSAFAGLIILVGSMGIGLFALHIVMGPLRRLRARAERTAIELTGEALPPMGGNEVTSVVKVLDALTNRMVRRNLELAEAKTSSDAANHAKSRFLSTMSHEIRTPLNGVLGVTELLRRTHLDQEQTRLVEAIASAGHTLLDLLGDILDLAKIEEGQIKLERVDFNPGQLVSDVTTIYREVAAGRGLSMDTEFGGIAQNWVSGDPTRLRQVLSNLLGNAIKFTQRGEVRLHIEPLEPRLDDPRAWWRFSVKDSGIGIAPDAIGALFQRFSQADASTTRQFGGTGLGLAICKHLVELMGGKIEVTSVIGKGSCFSFDLPLSPPTALPLVERSRHLPLIRTTARILVAEDNPVNQLVIKGLLGRFGATVTMVDNGAIAVERMRDNSFHLIFMDCLMPIMDGFEATRQIRAWEQTQSGTGPIPIIALTANALSGDREDCVEAGMTGYVTKPTTAARLAEVLTQHLPAELCLPDPSPLQSIQGISARRDNPPSDLSRPQPRMAAIAHL